MVKFKPEFERRYPRVERIIAIVALINLGLIFFDLTYLHLRSIYRQYLPAVTQIYDPVKGVEVHPATERYQMQVERLEAQLAETGVRSPQTEDSLAELRLLSQQLVIERTFVAPNGEYALATIQQNLQTRTGETSLQNAFDQFWSETYLEERGWQQELAFWNTQVDPLFKANYFRRVNSLATPINYFWLIDLPFVVIFAVDMLLRMRAMRRQNADLTWLNVVRRRWYDLFLLLPFWRWLRVIPVSLRLYQADLLDLEPVRAEAQRDTVVTVGADLAGIIGVELIDQVQDSIREGELLGWLSAVSPSNGNSPLQDSLEKDGTQQEIVAIANHVYDVGVHRVFPRIQPDLEALMRHSVTKTLEQLPGLPHLNHLPGVNQISTQMVQQLSNAVVEGISHSVAGAFLDAEGKKITGRLQHNLREAIAQEFTHHNTSEEIQSRLLDVLEKFKLRYVKALAEAGGEQLAERTDLLHRQIQ